MNAKPLAALTSSLLARKGQAKPAMRPQGFGGFGTRHEDLGWNDLGTDLPPPVVTPPPVVVVQQELAAHFEPEREPRPKGAVPAASKAAFTLRLDEERHLRLRLASAVKHRSSQQLVTEALDVLLAGMPELEELVAKAKRSAKK